MRGILSHITTRVLDPRLTCQYLSVDVVVTVCWKLPFLH